MVDIAVVGNEVLLRGVQVAVLNVSGDVSGAQVGVVNIAAGTVRGTQVGVVNVAGTYESGAPVGLVSLVKNATYHLELYGDWPAGSADSRRSGSWSCRSPPPSPPSTG